MHAGSAADCRGGLSVPGPAAGHSHTCALSHAAIQSAALTPGPQSGSLGQIALITVALYTDWEVREQVRDPSILPPPIGIYPSIPRLLLSAIDGVLIRIWEKEKWYPGGGVGEGRCT